MKIRDAYGSVIDLMQAKSGAVLMMFGDKPITLSDDQCDRFCMYDIEDFDVDLYRVYYNKINRGRGMYEKNIV